MELCLLNLLVLIGFCIILTLVCSLRTCHMWLTRNHMFISRINMWFLVNHIWQSHLGNVYLVYFFEILKSRFQKSELGKFIAYFPLKNVITSTNKYVKFGPTPSRKIWVIRFIESALIMMKDAFYLFFKARFVLKIFAVLLRIFGHAGKAAWLKRLISKFIKSPC